MRSYLMPFLGGMVAYMAVNVVVTMLTTSNQSPLFFLCPFVAALVADLWHARLAPVLSVEHLSVVFVPTLIMGLVQIVIAIALGGAFGALGYYLLALLLYLVVAGAAFAVSAMVRTLVFGYGYDADQEASAY